MEPCRVYKNLLRGSNLGLEAKVVLDTTVVGNVLQVATILDDTVAVTGLEVLLAAHVREAPLLRDDNLLATSELVTRATQRLDGVRTVAITRADRQKHLTNVDTGDKSVRLTEGTTHTRLQTVGTSARKHLVDTDDVVGVDTHTEVESILTRHLHHVLVGTDTSSFKGLRRNLLVFVTDKVDTEWEFIHRSLLTTQIVDTDLRVRHTTVVPRLGLSWVSIMFSKSLQSKQVRYIRKACSCSSGSNEQVDVPFCFVLVYNVSKSPVAKRTLTLWRGKERKFASQLPPKRGGHVSAICTRFTVHHV